MAISQIIIINNIILCGFCLYKLSLPWKFDGLLLTNKKNVSTFTYKAPNLDVKTSINCTFIKTMVTNQSTLMVFQLNYTSVNKTNLNNTGRHDYCGSTRVCLHNGGSLSSWQMALHSGPCCSSRKYLRPLSAKLEGHLGVLVEWIWGSVR